jgi:hypothetical protein
VNRTRSLTATGAVALALLAAACGDGSTSAASTTSTTSAPPTTPEPAPVIDVLARDYRFDGIPATIATGSQLTLTNTSEAEVHELIAFRLPDTETRTVAELMALPRAELEAVFQGPPSMVLVAPPASGGFPAVGTGVLTEPGRYLAFCAIPVGADPAAYLAAAQAAGGQPTGVAGGPPHFVAGMATELVVE